jgi:glutamate-1-semialdehyde 2,1-aminomutase
MPKALGESRPNTEVDGSQLLLERARRSIAGGESSTMRVLPYQLPLAVKGAAGARVWDVDGREIIDLNMAYGPLIFGHKPPFVIEAITKAIEQYGTDLGLPYELPSRVAELVKKSVPSIELLRFSSTGSEVDQSAVRLARTFTRRPCLVLFEGHYHGSTDSVFHRYHASVAQLQERKHLEALPGTNGLNGAPRDVFVVPWNDAGLVEELLAQHGESIAAVIMEPIAGNMGVVPPRPGYLERVRAATRACGALLVFDEVISGFRVDRGGAQGLYGVRPDLTTLSKAMSGGTPLSAVGGRADVLEEIVAGRVFHGGVFSGNVVAIAGALAAQEAFERDAAGIYGALQVAGDRLAAGLRTLFAELGVPAHVNQVGPMLSLWFLKEPAGDLHDYRGIARCTDAELYIRFQHEVQRNGVFFHPNHLEPWFLSTAHTPQVIDEALDRIGQVARAFDWRATRSAG